MRRRTRRSRAYWPIAWVAAACLVCSSIGMARLSSAAALLGPPSSSLPSWQTPFITAFLVVRRGALEAAAGDPAARATIDVEPGQSAADVVDRLAETGVVRDPFLLRTYLRYRGLDVGIQAGRYTLEGGQSLLELASVLHRAADSRYTLTVIEGWRREQIAQALGSMELGFTPADFLAATRRPPPWDVGGQTSTLEGFLFPDSYRLDPRWSAEDVARLMLETFSEKVDEDLRLAFTRQGLNLLEAVTLASIVEREAVLVEEKPVIASVFLNRLRQGMKLQSDPTVQYALGWQPDGTWWKSPLVLEELAVDSLYNTYLYGGLPPAPIASPGLNSLLAVADPTETSYFYFRAACDGRGAHLFAETFEEHVHNACP